MSNISNITETSPGPPPHIEIFEALPGILWPLLVLIVFCSIRKYLNVLLATLARQLAAGARVKYGDLEFGGIRVFPTLNVSGEHSVTDVSPATKSDRDRRNEFYKVSQNLNLVHKIRNSVEPGQKFDIEVSILAHKGKTRLNEIAYVEYYFGHHFGTKPHGAKYRVKDSSSGFAAITSAYGEFLCVADVGFHDGSTVVLVRYVDFEMAGDHSSVIRDAASTNS